jgi:hypothetical protein
MPLILDDPVLSEGTKESLLEHCQDTSVHTVLNVSFKDILHVVWNRILAFPESASEIKRVLETEMRDADGMCFIGRISRLVNCLNGFDSLVSIRISDSEQISNVISVARIFLLQSGEYTPEAHKEEVRKRLKELGVADDVIAEWVSNIE